MPDVTGIANSRTEAVLSDVNLPPEVSKSSTQGSCTSSTNGRSPLLDPKTPELSSPIPSPNLLSRNVSTSDFSSYQEEWETPLETLTVFDLLDNLALPSRLEKWQTKLSAQTERVRRQREKIKSSTSSAKDRVVEEWRRRLPPPDEQLDKYRKRMSDSVNRLGSRWHDTKAVTAREKLSFIAGVLNIFISGYLIGGHPDLFYVWFTAQLCYFMPIRFYTYHKRGYHYFLADMCYFVNFLLLLTIWVAPKSKRLFIGTYCLAYGNNAVAIAMWRNSMVFHSLDKVTSLFIHIMPPVTLHCLVHLTPPEIQLARFPGIYAIAQSSPGSAVHYSLLGMMAWSSVPYAVWQLSYHFFITVRRREKIAAGRPTSFTWLRRSYAKSWIGRLILGLPEQLQEPAFMLTQYLYALGSILPCPVWFWYRWPSAIFLLSLFVWSIYNGATYYIDVFGTRFQKELEQLKKDVAKWQTSPDAFSSPLMTPKAENGSVTPQRQRNIDETRSKSVHKRSESSIDQIPMLDAQEEGSSGKEKVADETVRERK
ncbi:MAG: hypothetical protein ALECFALPRED_005879 [Alectoria fallacina]|uniref:Glycerophosphocholine acyltransferase 1 n=1 Tax=Alectoria fallacina TaxID=1903189 RepID=A0A8H3G730_9LECA|nr:MAG: hypothetical protein ALECFALPRED_005879 [Alectoria fallacina]